jgi:hypothetical protein
MDGYCDDDDCTGGTFTAFGVGRVLSVDGRGYTVDRLEGELLEEALEKLGYDESGDPLPLDIHQVAARRRPGAHAMSFTCHAKEEPMPAVGDVGFLYHTTVGSGRYEIASQPQSTRRGVTVMQGYVDDDDCTGGTFTAFGVGRVMWVNGSEYTVDQIEGDQLEKALEKLGYDEKGYPVPPDIHDVAARFECFATEVEVISPSGVTETIEVTTDVFSDCYKMLDEITDREDAFYKLEADIEWWAKWGARRHKAEVMKARMLHEGRFDEADAPEMDGDFKADTLRLEAFIEELAEPAYAA